MNIKFYYRSYNYDGTLFLRCCHSVMRLRYLDMLYIWDLNGTCARIAPQEKQYKSPISNTLWEF